MLELIQSHVAQQPVLRGEIGARVRVIRAFGLNARVGVLLLLK